MLYAIVLKWKNYFDYGMILQKLDAVPEKKSPKWSFCPLISYRGHLTKYKGDVFYCLGNYVVWRSFEKISAETAEKECLEKNSTQNIMVATIISGNEYANASIM